MITTRDRRRAFRLLRGIWRDVRSHVPFLLILAAVLIGWLVTFVALAGSEKNLSELRVKYAELAQTCNASPTP
jgi:hypothetical protein